MGGRFKPLSDSRIQQIDLTARGILRNIGCSCDSESVTNLLLDAGAVRLENSRIGFPDDVVDETLAAANRQLVLCGQDPVHDLKLEPTQVYLGTGGASPNVIDLDTGVYRPSSLRDLYDLARLVDGLDNIQFFSRPVVAGDMDTPKLLDLNTAFAALKGTSKHVCTSISCPSHVGPVAKMCHAIAGGRGAFTERPFLSVLVNHVASPLRLVGEACEVLVAAVRHGLPVHINSFSLLGASTPVTIAGTLAQNIAETMAGVLLACSVDPKAAFVFGPRPMVTDLRTGALTGGSGEQAFLTASAVQLSRHLDLPNSTIAGATDSKAADAQSGYEKALSVTMAAHAGCNLITQACGTQASLMACSFGGMVVDNDMLGSILRSLHDHDLGAVDKAEASILEAVEGDGHFLGHTETMQRMKTDFLYPLVADRTSHEAWTENGSRQVIDRARDLAISILQQHHPSHLDAGIEAGLRKRFPLRL